jgi:hypothetical protein
VSTLQWHEERSWIRKNSADSDISHQLLGQRTFLYVRLSSLTCLPGFNDNGEAGAGWKA